MIKRAAAPLLAILMLPLSAPMFSCWGNDFDTGSRAASHGDFATALKVWQKPAQQGDASDQFNIGILYEHGLGVVQEYAEAVKLYREAAQQGFAPAQNNLGIMLSTGQGVRRANIEGYMWFDIATSLGNKSSAKGRRIVARKLSPAQTAEAQRLARDWLAKFEARKPK
jgi:uncharacterized protein